MCTGSISSNIYSCALILHANVLNRDLKHLSSKGPSCPCSRRESIWCGGSFSPQSLTLRGELHYPSNRRICVSESWSELFLFGGKENLLPRIFGRTLRDPVTVPAELSQATIRHHVNINCFRWTVPESKVHLTLQCTFALRILVWPVFQCHLRYWVSWLIFFIFTFIPPFFVS